MRSPTVWYVVANGGRARIVERRKDTSGFITHKAFTSPTLHLQTKELGTDRPGRTHESNTVARHALQPRSDLHRMAKQNFAHEMAEVLNRANASGDFDHLVLVAPPRVMHDLCQGLDSQTMHKVTAQLQKDFVKTPDAKLGGYFTRYKPRTLAPAE
jgi:protein required for attachment to host cells